MMLKRCVVVVLAILLAGCSSNKQPDSQKAQAEKRWREARAAVLGSLARSQYESGNLDKSQQTVNEALLLAPQNVNLRLLNAKLAMEKNRLEAADRELAEARRLDENNAEADYYSGVIYQRWQKPDLAYEFYTRASQKAPSELAYLMARAEMLVAMNRQDEALSLLQEKVAYFENSALVRDTIGQLLVDQGRYAEAVESLRKASILATDDPAIREHLARAYFRNRQYREASDLIGRLLKDPAHAQRPELHLVLGECQLQMGRAGDARASFDLATQLNPSSPIGWTCLAKAAMQLGDNRRAEMSLRKAILLAPNDSESRLLLGYVRLRQDRLNDAMAEFQKAASLDRGDPVSLCMIGYVHERLGRPDVAVRYYAAALKVRPDDELAQKLIATVQTN